MKRHNARHQGAHELPPEIGLHERLANCASAACPCWIAAIRLNSAIFWRRQLLLLFKAVSPISKTHKPYAECKQNQRTKYDYPFERLALFFIHLHALSPSNPTAAFSCGARSAFKLNKEVT